METWNTTNDNIKDQMMEFNEQNNMNPINNYNSPIVITPSIMMNSHQNMNMNRQMLNSMENPNNMYNMNMNNNTNNNAMMINSQNNVYNQNNNNYCQFNNMNPYLNPNMNNINQNVNYMNQNQFINMNNNNPNNYINSNFLNPNNVNNKINDRKLNNPNINEYNVPTNCKISEKSKVILNNDKILRGQLISNPKTISPTLRCSICLDLVMDPVECDNCSKLFCKYCIEKWLNYNNNECPNMHDFIKKEDLDQWAKNVLGKINLRCPYIGCGSNYAYKFWKDHVKNCIFKNKGIRKFHLDDPNKEEEKFIWENIQFFVKAIDGRTYLFCLPLSTTVKELKENLEQKTGFKVEDQILSCNGKYMEDNKLLEYYELKENQNIFQLTRLKGGNLIIY